MKGEYMKIDFYNENKLKNDYILSKIKDNHISYIDKIPEQYKRREYIIDKLNSKKRNVD